LNENSLLHLLELVFHSAGY